jgi:phage terminase large subunit-like protein
LAVLPANWLNSLKKENTLFSIASSALLRTRRGDQIIAETNNGGEMVKNTLRMIDPSVPFGAVWASQGGARCKRGESHAQDETVLKR